jgi:hypothetical protein
MHVRKSMEARRLAARAPVTYLAFDVLRLYGVDLIDRSFAERAGRDGNKIVDLEAAVADLTDLAARAEASERALFEAEGRAENAVRRAELMEGELMSTRAEVDRMRTRVIELEASLRRALAEVGAGIASRAPDDTAAERAARMEASAMRSADLADRLRLKVIDLESSLRAVLTDMNEATAAQLRAEVAEAALTAVGEAQVDDERAAEAEGRLVELEERLAALDTRIAALSMTMHPEPGDTVVDLREAEADVDVEPEGAAEPELPEAPASDEVPIAPPA